MANTKISQLTPNTNPTGNEELVYAFNNANGKMTLNTMKTFTSSDSQPTLVSWTNIKTINNQSILWPWNIDIQWGGGGWADASYDAIVDASWSGDYTLVSDAIAAWKFNIFVKNWSYTETAWWDAYTKSSSFLRIIWESKKWVQIIFPNTITTPNKVFIDMRYGGDANFYMENLSFTIALSSDNTRFFDDNWWYVMVRDCSFTYSSTVSGELFNSNWLRFYNCDFTASSSAEVRICSNDYSAYGCNFSSTGWLLQMSSSDEVRLYDCTINTYSIWWVSNDLHLFNSALNIDGWVISWALSMAHVCNSNINIANLQSTPSLIEISIASNSDINMPSYELNLWNAYDGVRWVELCQINAARVYNLVYVTNCSIAASTSVDVWSNNIVMWCKFPSGTTAITLNNNSNFIWNRLMWTWTMTLSSHDDIVMWNNMPNFTISDTWTWNIKANNITAA